MRHLGRLAASCLVGAVALTAVTAMRISDQGGSDERRPVDAIVVLGAAQYDGRPSPVLEARVEHAVGLYRAGFAPLLVMTGGRAAGDRTTEAAAARDWAIAHGVPADAIVIEGGRTTLESLEGVATLLRERGLGKALMVSDRTHMLRVLRIATDLGIDAWGSPTPSSPVDADQASRFQATVHELAALAVYFAGGGHIVLDEPVSPAR